jgi:hypothetical protein
VNFGKEPFVFDFEVLVQIFGNPLFQISFLCVMHISIFTDGNFVIDIVDQAYIYEERLKLQLVAEKAPLQSGLPQW